MGNHDQKPDSNRESARRRLLKATLVGGGAAAAMKTMPDQWARPVIDSVVLPAHGETSPGEQVTGVFTATNVGDFVVNMQPDTAPSRGIQYALLEALSPRANADHIVGGICGDDDNAAPAEVVIRINEDGTVDIAVSTDAVVSACGATTTINADNTINDVSVQLDGDEFLDLSNMVASAAEINGSWAASIASDGGDVVGCNGSFTAPLGGSFPSTVDCSESP